MAKEVTQKGKYGDTPQLGSGEEVVIDRLILNISKDLSNQIKKHVFDLKMQGEQRADTKTGEMKAINYSTWARDVLKKELRSKGIDV